MTRSEILSNVYCPAIGGTHGHPDTGHHPHKTPEANLARANAVCIDGSRAALALSLSNHGSRNVEARRQEALWNAVNKATTAGGSSCSRSEDLPPLLNSNTAACERSEHKKFVVMAHGFPIDPDYAIMSRPPPHHASHNSLNSNSLNSHNSLNVPSPRNQSISQMSSNCTTPIFGQPSSRISGNS